MNQRVLTSLGVTVLASAIAVVWLATAPAAAQAQKAAGTPAAKQAAAAKPWTAPKTPDGVPDLQGYWTNNSYTPLERPNGVTKDFYTLEELRAVEKKNAEREEEQTVPGTVADALRLHAIRPGSEPDQAGGQPANVGHHEPGEWEAPSGQRGGPEEGRRPRR